MPGIAPKRDQVTGLILAGGQARRMGGADKGLLEIRGRPLIEWVIDSIAPQVSEILISANRNQGRYAAYGHRVVEDVPHGFQGPLAGILSGMRAAGTPWILTLPCDGPSPPEDLLQRLAGALARADAEIAMAHDGQRMQPIHALLPVALADSLEAFLATGDRKVELWCARHRVAIANFSDIPTAFVNLNSPEEIRLVEDSLSFGSTPNASRGR